MADQAQQDELIQQFASVTGADPQTSKAYLAQANWDPQIASNNWFAVDQNPSNDPDYEPDEAAGGDEPSHSYPGGGGQTLGGEGVPSRRVAGSVPAAASSSSSRPARGGRSGMATLRDLQQSDPPAGRGHGHDDSDDEGDDDEQEFYTGGDKSGLAVQNPNSAEDAMNRVLRKAARNTPRPGGDEAPAPRVSHFAGRGQTLGGDDTPSTVIEPISSASDRRPPPRVHRELHLWRDGFTIDDGPLYPINDPENAATLNMINSGRAPLDLLQVEQGQEVDLQVYPHRDEDYKPPKKKYKPFSGSGQRLGSPTPGMAASSTTASSSSAVVASSSSAPADTSSAAFQVDDSQPTLILQIRLGDGTQLRSRFNTSHTIGDVYGFVDASGTESRSRGYVLMTTFPSKELTDRGQVLGDMSEFKRGGVVVQKWT